MNAGLKLRHAPVEISIALDSYDYIFSDFDPRPYSTRTISDDFIQQTRKVAKDKFEKITVLRLFLTEAVRNKDLEEMIALRLNTFFATTHQQKLTERKKIIYRGTVLTLTGILIMIIVGSISFFEPRTYFVHFLLVFFEPAGWFMLWIGLDYLINHPEKIKKELNFYSKMTNTKIEFSSFPEGVKGDNH